MDMTTTTTTTMATTISGGGGGLSLLPPTKSTEAESEVLPRIHPRKPISTTNGVLKRQAPPNSKVAYKECLKNHAASLGGHALDGCGEFMLTPTASASDPTSLKCAACGCHRNFHRREVDNLSASPIPSAVTHLIEYHPQHRHHPLPPPGARNTQTPPVARGQSPDSQSPPPISSSFYPGSGPHHMLLALSGGGAHTENNKGPDHHQQQQQPSPSSRKRFRTKFSQDQKEKMFELAVRVGWKMQKTKDDLVNGFCNKIGVERGVFKVWMHNNKYTFGKKSTNSPSEIADDVNPIHSQHRDHHQEQFDTQHHHQYNGKCNESDAPTNGSSSSS